MYVCCFFVPLAASVALYWISSRPISYNSVHRPAISFQGINAPPLKNFFFRETEFAISEYRLDFSKKKIKMDYISEWGKKIGKFYAKIAFIIYIQTERILRALYNAFENHCGDKSTTPKSH